MLCVLFDANICSSKYRFEMKQPKTPPKVANFEDPILSIGVMAEKVGVSPETLRLYEREGLLLPKKSAKGTRSYSLHDVVRVLCIRSLIHERKMNIAGIKHLLALIPCWDIKPCSENERQNCPAYLNNIQVCWELENTGTDCKNFDCRDCEVYKQACDEVGDMKSKYLMTVKK